MWGKQDCRKDGGRNCDKYQSQEKSLLESEFGFAALFNDFQLLEQENLNLAEKEEAWVQLRWDAYAATTTFHPQQMNERTAF